jgi:hypothetical protein
MARRWCAWCKVEPIPPRARADRLTCSTACKRALTRARALGFAGDRAAWRRLPTIRPGAPGGRPRRHVPIPLGLANVPATTAGADERAP